MNWGKGITIAFILFAAFIGSLVVQAFTRDADLTRDDYYESELEYDINKEKRRNYADLAGEITVSQQPEGVILQLPDPVSGQSVGNVHFYRPDKKKYDRKFDLNVDQNGSQTFDYTDFKEGRYEVNVEWKEGEVSYLGKTEIIF